MNRLVLILGIILLIVNILLGFILSSYSVVNSCLNSIVIGLTLILLYFTNIVTLRNALKISLRFIFTFVGVVAFIVGFFAPTTIVDNWFLVVLLILTLFELILLLVTNYISKSVKQ